MENWKVTRLNELYIHEQINWRAQAVEALDQWEREPFFSVAGTGTFKN